MSVDVLIVGFSGRAAAGSARRAGVKPIVVDCFADRDTAAYAEVHQCPPEHFLQGLLPIIEKMPKFPVVFCGGMEHEPELIAAIRGPSEATTNYVEFVKTMRGMITTDGDMRSWMRRRIATHMLPTRYASWTDYPYADQPTLTKPYRSGGGVGIRPALPSDPQPGFYLQPLYEGVPYSSSFRRIGSQTDCLGTTKQLIGESWLHARDYSYCGNIGPTTLPEGPAAAIENWGTVVAGFTHFNSHWGFDFVLGDLPRMIEVNPRYTASMEVLEHSTGRALLANDLTVPVPPGIVGKAIYYAPFDLIVPESAAFDEAVAVAADPWALPEFADIPHVGERIAKGTPVVTILTRQADEDAVLAELKRQAMNLDELFEGCRA